MEMRIEQSFLHTGAHYNRKTGLYYLKVRYYSPELRRFILLSKSMEYLWINLYFCICYDFVNYGDWEGKFPIKLIIATIVSHKTYKFVKFSYKCFICLSKFNGPEMQECRARYSDPDHCLNNNVVFLASEILKKCYPKECDEGCMELLKWIYKTAWKGGRP